MIFTVHTPTCSIHFEDTDTDGEWKATQVIDRKHHRELLEGERQPLIVIKPDELIVRTDWEAMLKTASEDELRGVRW